MQAHIYKQIHKYTHTHTEYNQQKTNWETWAMLLEIKTKNEKKR